MSRFTIVTLFPEIFGSFLKTSLIGKALENGHLDVDFIDPRDFTTDRHRTVDDAPFGGGEGMVLKPEPWVAAIESIPEKPRRVLVSPKGKPLDQAILGRFAGYGHVMLVCGRYEGFDERIREFVDEEVSLGDFVMAGGEVAAMAVIEGVGRLLPEVLGNEQSTVEESHQQGLLEYPHYTRPRTFRNLEVPDVLLSGDHRQIARWRQSQRLAQTRRRRPDLWRRYLATQSEEGERRRDAIGPVHIALLHYPVYDREGQVVSTALTNLDLHDIARSSRTYGLSGYTIVTPIESQRELARQITGHWRDGHGATHNQHRAEALALIDTAGSLEELVERLTTQHGEKPAVVATSAKPSEGAVSSEVLVATLEPAKPLLILLGTGWGLHRDVLAQADFCLKPILGPGTYNHLSVRSAAAIVLDRLFGIRE